MIQRKHLHILSFIMIGFIMGWASHSILGKTKRHSKGEPPSISHFDKLGLKQDVLKKVQSIHKAAGIEDKRLKRELKEDKKNLNTAIETTNDNKKIRELYNKFISKRSTLEQLRFETMMKVHSHLSLDQIKKLRSLGPPLKKHKKRRRH